MSSSKKYQKYLKYLDIHNLSYKKHTSKNCCTTDCKLSDHDTNSDTPHKRKDNKSKLISKLLKSLLEYIKTFESTPEFSQKHAESHEEGLRISEEDLISRTAELKRREEDFLRREEDFLRREEDFLRREEELERREEELERREAELEKCKTVFQTHVKDFQRRAQELKKREEVFQTTNDEAHKFKIELLTQHTVLVEQIDQYHINETKLKEAVRILESKAQEIKSENIKLNTREKQLNDFDIELKKREENLDYIESENIQLQKYLSDRDLELAELRNDLINLNPSKIQSKIKYILQLINDYNIILKRHSYSADLCSILYIIKNSLETLFMEESRSIFRISEIDEPFTELKNTIFQRTITFIKEKYLENITDSTYEDSTHDYPDDFYIYIETLMEQFCVNYECYIFDKIVIHNHDQYRKIDKNIELFKQKIEEIQSVVINEALKDQLNLILKDIIKHAKNITIKTHD